MKVRIGIGSIPLAAGPGPGPELADLVDELEARRIDSLWLADQASAPLIDPLVGMGFAVSRTRHLKVGSGVVVLPGRNPALVAAQLASLAALAPKRILPAFGVRPAIAAERQLFPAPNGDRAALFDESLTVVRRLLAEPRVTHHGRFFHLDDVSVAPLPPRSPDIWLGGRAPAGLRRVGRLADGWLGSLVTPDEAADARAQIERAAAEAGREIEDDHYGTNIAVAPPDASEADVAAARERVTRRRPDLDPACLVPHGWGEARELVRRYVDAGLTKFVVRPAAPVPAWAGFLDQLASELRPLEDELSDE
ncbi:TIGR03854 family LLM class F420-dependent oxidoreductase [Pseudonocardia sp. DSM 110487]|uniref:TIGR03854 family LLM class F420-dependent oxidoreductase n=1 Tax=Pseudonocardia sp. DSM 110487 TaxID=2865833 RepID=UPI001C69D10A|nr:TIGR03854 family LLM class F420-dependent oxidoreductase [Pseudonocardia sp. DSM 110487]QYN34430.1 TIGR03854 family LLM class F420-dependent oxidoreductase [Pseudonocardia sp. DSM 110487]